MQNRREILPIPVITTGIPELDGIIGGGLPVGCVSQFLCDPDGLGIDDGLVARLLGIYPDTPCTTTITDAFSETESAHPLVIVRGDAKESAWAGALPKLKDLAQAKGVAIVGVTTEKTPNVIWKYFSQLRIRLVPDDGQVRAVVTKCQVAPTQHREALFRWPKT